MEAIRGLLERPETIDVALFLAACAWTAFKGSAWWARHRDAEVERALTAVAVSVDAVGREYVRDLKAGRKDGALTPDEVRTAHSKAKVRLRNLAREEGINLGRALGESSLDYWIARIAEGLKSGTGPGVVLPRTGATTTAGARTLRR